MTNRRVVLAVAATGVGVMLLALLAPLRQINADALPNRYGAALLVCGGTTDLRRVDWIAGLDRLPYWARRDADDRIVSVFGPAPAVAGMLAFVDVGEGDELTDESFRRRARVVAAFAVALASCLLVLASLARHSLRVSIGIGAAAALSFAGVATLGQALWQQSISLPILMGAVAMFAWRERRPRLALSIPALLLASVMIRPTITPLAFGLGLVWLLERRSWRAIAIAAALALVAALPFAIWNFVHFGLPFPTGQFAANAALTDHVFVWSRAQLGYGLGGLLLSPGRGMVWFAPIVIVGIVQAIRRGSRVDRAIAGALIAQILVVAFFHMWWGGICFGPRFLAEVTWVGVALASQVKAPRALFAVTIGVTVIVGQLGLWCWRVEQWETRRNPDIDQNALWDFADSPLTSLARSANEQPYAVESVYQPAAVTCRDGRLDSSPAADR